MTIHDFDMARFLMGCDVHEVFAAAGVRVDPQIGEAGDVDTCVIVLRFKNGAIGAIDNCRKSVAGYDQRVEVLGSKGTFSTGGPPSAENAVQKNLQLDLGHIHRSFFSEGLGCSQADSHCSKAVCCRNGGWPIVKHVLHKILDLGNVSLFKTLHEVRNDIMGNAFLFHDQDGGLHKIADLQRAFGAPDLRPNIVAKTEFVLSCTTPRASFSKTMLTIALSIPPSGFISGYASAPPTE